MMKKDHERRNASPSKKWHHSMNADPTVFRGWLKINISKSSKIKQVDIKSSQCWISKRKSCPLCR